MSMTRVQLLLGKIAEECVEVAQRALKAQQFGMSEVQPGQEFSNAERLRQEFVDLVAVASMLENEEGVPLTQWPAKQIAAKCEKVEKFARLSQELGMVESAI